MKRKILIIYDPHIKDKILIDRIKSLGRNFSFWENHWLIDTDHSCKEIYNIITKDNFESSSILITEIKDKEYWGRMQKSLWEWFKNNDNRKK